MDEADVRDLLADVSDPDLGGDIVSLGLVNSVQVESEDEIEPGGEGQGDVARISLALGAPYSPTETAIADRVRTVLADAGLEADLTARIGGSATGGSGGESGSGSGSGTASEEEVLPDVENVIAVASGKGGVGKSTIAVNVAAGLAERGARVGLFDADVYGPNVPRMVAADDGPRATAEETLVPPERFGVKLMSMAFLVGKDDPVIWRGPMVHKVITQLTEDVAWGPLDYLVIDLPPGTGDTQLTVLQTIPLTGAVVVTTPQGVAVDDARKALQMFGRHETTVLGIVENMRTFVCPDCGGEHDIFGAGGGEAFAEEVEMPFLGSIPLDPRVRAGGDGGEPAVLTDTGVGEALRSVTGTVADMVGVVRRRGHAERARVRAES